MLILLALVALGVLASVWGFLMCFFPTRWQRLTETMSFAHQWTEPAPKRVHPLIQFANRIGGLGIFAGGCWFTYMASSEIYSVIAKRTVTHSISTELPNSPTPGVTVLSVVITLAGVLMAVFPGKALAILNQVWPTERSVSPLAAPRVMWFLRLCGAFFAVLAVLALLHDHRN